MVSQIYIIIALSCSVSDDFVFTMVVQQSLSLSTPEDIIVSALFPLVNQVVSRIQKPLSVYVLLMIPMALLYNIPGFFLSKKIWSELKLHLHNSSKTFILVWGTFDHKLIKQFTYACGGGSACH